MPLLQALASGYKSKPQDFSLPMKTICILGEYMERTYQNKFYAKSQNLNLQLTKAYDVALKKFDVLIMPTLPTKPLPLPQHDTGVHG